MAVLTNPQTIILLLAFIGGFASIIAVALPFLRRDQRASRLKAVAERRQELSRQQHEDMAKKRSRRPPTARVDAMKVVLQRFKLENMAASKELKRKLAAAGYRQQGALITFVFVRFALAIVKRASGSTSVSGNSFRMSVQ